jgi:hypothetical protein
MQLRSGALYGQAPQCRGGRLPKHLLVVYGKPSQLPEPISGRDLGDAARRRIRGVKGLPRNMDAPQHQVPSRTDPE